MPVHRHLPDITNGGNKCSLLVNPQNLKGTLRLYGAHHAGPNAAYPRSKAALDVMNQAFAQFSKRSVNKDNLLQNTLNSKDQWLARPPPIGKNLLGDSTVPAYQKVEGAAFLQGYSC